MRRRRLVTLSAVAAGLACCLGVASAQEEDSTSKSCVQVVDVVDDFSLSSGQSNCRACGQISFSFAVEGTTSVEANTVNLALVIDGSGSIYSTEWTQEKEFAKDVVSAFSERGLFDNGGTASYVQFESSVASNGTFSTQEDFDDFVDADLQSNGGTDIAAGIAQGQRLMSATDNGASGAVMIVITDGESDAEDAETEADIARSEGTNIFAVGVGTGFDNDTLVAVAGSASRVFDTDSFDELDEALDGLLATDALVSCEATNATITVEFNYPIESVSYPGAVVSGDAVTFEVENLEGNPTEFAAVLDICITSDGTANAISSITYSDAQDNNPDFSIAEEAADLTCEAGASGRATSDFVSTIFSGGVVLVIIGGMFRGLPSVTLFGTIGNIFTLAVPGSALTSAGSALTGAGSALTGAGSAVTGAGSALTGAGSALTGAGSAVTGAGSAVTGAGSAVAGAGAAIGVSAGAASGVYAGGASSQTQPASGRTGRNGSAASRSAAPGNANGSNPHADAPPSYFDPEAGAPPSYVDPEADAPPSYFDPEPDAPPSYFDVHPDTNPGDYRTPAPTTRTDPTSSGTERTTAPMTGANPTSSGTDRNTAPTTGANPTSSGTERTTAPTTGANPTSSGTDRNTAPTTGAGPTVSATDAVGRSDPAYPTVIGEDTGSVSGRRPSATLALLIARQLQFLAMLSLIDYVVLEDSFLADFVFNLRWVHFWLRADAFEGVVSDSCMIEESPSDLNVLVFIGNLMLVAGFLVAFLLLHVVVVSGVEAYWLVKARAREDVQEARRSGSRALDQVPPAPLSGTDGVFQDALSKCRSLSQSIWLHFPHVELSFLLYSYEGATAAYFSAFRHSGCLDFRIPSLMFLALYPLMLVVTTWRTISARVQSDVPLVFRPANGENMPKPPSGFKDFFRRLWRDKDLFSWATKGTWETVPTSDSELREKWEWFRIGWEPVFADYTKPGTWFVMILLFEWTFLAVVGVFVDDSMLQLFLYAVIRVFILVVLLWLRPYVNSVINTVEVCSVVKDIIGLVFMGFSAEFWEGTEAARAINTVVGVVEFTSLFVMILPVYVTDLPIVWSLVITEAQKVVTACCCCCCNRSNQPRENQDSRHVSRITRTYKVGQWCSSWGTMVRENMAAYIEETKEGFRKATMPNAPPSSEFPGIVAGDDR